MSYQVLARKWRPRNFESMVGQRHVVQALANALDSDRLHHAFLFTGTRGVGKTTVARILAKCLNCEQGVGSKPCGQCGTCLEIDEGRFLDLLEVDAASRSKVDETRELMDNVQFTPTRGRFKVYLIDEVHMFSEKSFNALLKTLEEPPPHVKFLLATTDPQKIPVTVLSRCLQFNLKRLPSKEIADHLARILEQENTPADREAIRLVADAADGSMRDALSLVDQAIAYGGGKLETPDTRAMLGSLERGDLFALLDALARGDANALMSQVAQMAGEVTDYFQALGEVLSELQHIAMVQAVPDALEDDPRRDRLTKLAAAMPAQDVQLYYQIGLLGRRDLPLAPDPRAGFEMALLRMHAFTPLDGDRGATATGGATGGSDTTQARADAGAAPASRAQAAPQGERRDWRETIAMLGLKGMVRELAANCALSSWRDGHVRLALAPQHRQLLGASIQEQLRAALENASGRPVKLTVDVIANDEATPAKLREREVEKRREDAVRIIEQDPGIQALCDTFDTRVDPSSIRPTDVPRD